jgi:NAD+ kinase
MANKRRPARIERVMIVCKRQQPQALPTVRQIVRLIEKRDIEVFLDPETSRALKRRPRGTRTPPDLYVVLGGDGTLLSVARSIAAHPRPILGVNLGGLGFLAEIGPEEAREVLDEVLSGHFELEQRMALEVALMRSRRTIVRQRVLNDVVINKSAVARIIGMDLKLDGHFVTVYRADGLIVATPTGSTAYSLSAGGPVIQPDMEAVVIAPICPHTLTMRPLVVPAQTKVEIALRTGGSEVYLTLDGQVGYPLRAHDRVKVKRSHDPVLMVRTGRRNHYDVLCRKLGWGER